MRLGGNIRWCGVVSDNNDTDLHPPLFSILFEHFGHSRVLALIHWAVPASSLAFFSHKLTQWQSTGRWSESELHPKQNECWLLQVAVGTKVVNVCFEPVPTEDEMVSVHEG